MVVSREEGSGTRGYFESAVMKSTGKEITDHAIIQDSNGKIRTTVAGDKHSIGFLSLGHASSDVKTLTLDGVAPSTENVRSGEYAILTDTSDDHERQAGRGRASVSGFRAFGRRAEYRHRCALHTGGVILTIFLSPSHLQRGVLH
ncbi:MAG: substrate-binding domain-containing protein [Euryarchaeota archaeon]|nr:substrate-binding domain-containing protein [Euryarchaeota archaeon]